MCASREYIGCRDGKWSEKRMIEDFKGFLLPWGSVMFDGMEARLSSEKWTVNAREHILFVDIESSRTKGSDE